MSNVSREAKRKALAALLRSELAGSLNPVQLVYDLEPPDLQGDTPIVTVKSAGTDRRNQGTKPASSGLCWRLPLQFDVQIWVLYYMAEEGWTDAESEDKIDALEMAISDVIANNAHGSDWEDLVYRDVPKLDYATVNRRWEYRRETIPLLMTVKVG